MKGSTSSFLTHLGFSYRRMFPQVQSLEIEEVGLQLDIPVEPDSIQCVGPQGVTFVLPMRVNRKKFELQALKNLKIPGKSWNDMTQHSTRWSTYELLMDANLEDTYAVGLAAEEILCTFKDGIVTLAEPYFDQSTAPTTIIKHTKRRPKLPPFCEVIGAYHRLKRQFRVLDVLIVNGQRLTGKSRSERVRILEDIGVRLKPERSAPPVRVLLPNVLSDDLYVPYRIKFSGKALTLRVILAGEALVAKSSLFKGRGSVRGVGGFCLPSECGGRVVIADVEAGVVDTGGKVTLQLRRITNASPILDAQEFPECFNGPSVFYFNHLERSIDGHIGYTQEQRPIPIIDHLECEYPFITVARAIQGDIRDSLSSTKARRGKEPSKKDYRAIRRLREHFKGRTILHRELRQAVQEPEVPSTNDSGL